MAQEIRSLTFRWVNAYLVRTGAGFVLIDTGFTRNRAQLENVLSEAGCRAGDLKLIVVTHGDPDHAASAAYLREKYGARIVMHRAEAAAVEWGDMFLSRGPLSPRARMIRPLTALFRLRKSDRFTPDLYLEDGGSLREYGFDAVVLHVPGHSAGSIAVLTVDGDLFSGDFLENRTCPSVATLVDDRAALAASLEKVRKLSIRTVYPGHGAAFTMAEMG